MQEFGIFPKPENIFPVDEINNKDLARRTGGTPDGGILGFYGDDFYINWRNGYQFDTAVEGYWDEGCKPALNVNGSSIGLMQSRVILTDKSATFVRSTDADKGFMHLTIVAVEDGTVSVSMATKSLAELEALDEQIKTAAALSLEDSRKEIAEEERRHEEAMKSTVVVNTPGQ